MPSSKSYLALHEEVLTRPGAEERLEALRSETLTGISPIAFATDPGALAGEHPR